MEIKEFEAEYTYDCNLDVVNIEVKKEYIHDKSIDLAFGVFLDFDTDHLPVNLEIVSASKILGVEKKLLLNPEGSVTIIIASEIIKVEVSLNFKNDNESLQLTGLNDYGMPNSESCIAIT